MAEGSGVAGTATASTLDEFDFLQDTMAFLEECDPVMSLQDSVVAAAAATTTMDAGSHSPVRADDHFFLEEEFLSALDLPTHNHPSPPTSQYHTPPPESQTYTRPMASTNKLKAIDNQRKKNSPTTARVKTDKKPRKQPLKTNGKMRNPSRERLQNELAYLRKKVVEMESELAALQQQGTHTAMTNAASTTTRSKSVQLIPVWQRIAERQLEGRQEAETENTQLKQMLEGQIKLAKGLEQMLRAQPNASVLSDNLSSDQSRQRMGPDDGTTYEFLMRGLDDAFRRMDSVFQANGLDVTLDESVRHAYPRTRRIDDFQDIIYVELMDVTIIPFDLDTTGNAAWRSVMLQYLKENRATYQDVHQPEDTIAVKFTAKRVRKGAEVLLDTALVMRRYVEKERMVLVWRSLSRARNERLSGMYTDETGWSVLKKIPPSADEAMMGTVMLSCVHVVPHITNGSFLEDMDAEVGFLTHIVTDSYEDDVIAINKTMENLLLEEALAAGDGVIQQRARAVSQTKQRFY